jgi:hypothetical protein
MELELLPNQVVIAFLPPEEQMHVVGLDPEKARGT